MEYAPLALTTQCASASHEYTRCRKIWCLKSVAHTAVRKITATNHEFVEDRPMRATDRITRPHNLGHRPAPEDIHIKCASYSLGLWAPFPGHPKADQTTPNSSPKYSRTVLVDLAGAIAERRMTQAATHMRALAQTIT